jgi:hypothetical protein
MAYARRMSSDAFVPADFEVPHELVSGTFRLEPLGPQHNEPDFAAWTSSADHIHSTPGWVGHDWPDLSMTLQDNMGDLVRHARDFEQRQGFTYTVEELGTGETIGCVYIYPTRAGGEGDAQVKSWVRADRAELDPVLYRAVSDWLARDWPFTAPHYDAR